MGGAVDERRTGWGLAIAGVVLVAGGVAVKLAVPSLWFHEVAIGVVVLFQVAAFGVFHGPRVLARALVRRGLGVALLAGLTYGSIAGMEAVASLWPEPQRMDVQIVLMLPWLLGLAFVMMSVLGRRPHPDEPRWLRWTRWIVGLLPSSGSGFHVEGLAAEPVEALVAEPDVGAEAGVAP